MLKYAQIFTFLTILLFGTACNGPDQKGLPKEKVAHIKLIKIIGSPHYNVRCGLQDKAGNLWFGTRNGLYQYDGKSLSQFTVANGLNSNHISCLLEDKEGKIWIGTDAGLCLYDGKTLAEIQIPLPKNLPPNTNDLYRNSHWVFSIMQAKSGKLWFATIDGVYIYDGQSFTPFIVNEGARGFGSSNHNVEHILEDKRGNIWLGGRPNEGVYRYDGKSVTNMKPVELSYPRDTGPLTFDSTRMGQDWVWPQLQDKNGNIWFSNWDGVYRYDGQSFTSFTTKEGLSGDMVTRMIEDKKGEPLVWWCWP